MTRQESNAYSRRWYAKQSKTSAGRRKLKLWRDNGNLKHNHGITLDEFNSRLAAQGGVCAICGRSPKCQDRRFSMDHSHKTGKLRGILCSWCNRIIMPIIEDYRWILKPAVRYYNKHQRLMGLK